MSGLSTRSPVLSPCAPGWRSNRLCVIKWWRWLYLTFVKGGAPDFCRSVLSAAIQWINPQKMLFLAVNTGIMQGWVEGNVFADFVQLFTHSLCSRRDFNTEVWDVLEWIVYTQWFTNILKHNRTLAQSIDRTRKKKLTKNIFKQQKLKMYELFLYLLWKLLLCLNNFCIFYTLILQVKKNEIWG